MATKNKITLDDVLNALDRLLNLFRIERIIHLVVGIIAFLMLLASIVFLIQDRSQINTTLLVVLFGSSGLITISSARITYFFNKGFKLIEEVTHQLIGIGGKK